VGEGDLILSDALAHASIVDGCRLSRAEVRIVPHGDLDALETQLRAHAAPRRRILVALDGVYSMDGDVSPLGELVPLLQRYAAICLLDDAHGTGTLGPGGRGTPELFGVSSAIDVWTGTLGKALGSFGAFAAGSRALRDLLVNVARSFIFTCALPPPQIEAARAALRVLVAEPWRRIRLHERADRLRARLAGHGISTAPSTTHIVPVVIGGNAETMALCERLLARGFYTQGIRHPSVPVGTARLRITPMATHSVEEVDALADAIAAELPQALASRAC
jgi:7-keto-8-aminopelargonate synthetase-like enzyme